MNKTTSFYKSVMFKIILFFSFFALPFIVYADLFINDFLFISIDGTQYIAPKILVKNAILEGNFPLWNKYSSMGTPFIADMVGAFFPLSLLLCFLPLKIYVFSLYALSIAIGAFFLFLYLKELGCNNLTAAITGFIYALSIHLGGYRKDHLVIITTVIYIPVIFYFIEKFITTSKLKWLLCSSLAMALQFYANFPQLVVYTNITAFLYLSFRLYKDKKSFKSIIKTLFLWGSSYIGLIALQLLPSLQMAALYKAWGSTKLSFGIFQSYSISLEKISMTIFPYIFGDNVYYSFGEYKSSGIDVEIFLGTLVFIVILFAIKRCWNLCITKFCVFMLIVTFLYAANTQIEVLSKLLYLTPVLEGFRVPARSLFLFNFFAFVLFALGLSHLEKEGELVEFFKLCKKTLILGMVISIISCIFIPEKINMPILVYFKTAFLKPLLIIAFFTIVVTFLLNFFQNRRNLYYRFLVVILFIVTMYEILPFSTVTAESNVSDFEVKSQSIIALEKDIGNYKILDAFIGIDGGHKSIISQNKNLVDKISAINSYLTINNPRLYKLLNLTSANPPLNYSGLFTGFTHSTVLLFQRNDILSMMGIKYIIDSNQLIEENEKFSYWGEREKTVFQENEIIIPQTGSDGIYVFYEKLPLVSRTYYELELTINTPQKPSIFYLDFYNGEGKYDHKGQVFTPNIKVGNKKYKYYLRTTDVSVVEDLYVRIVARTEEPIEISGFKVTQMQTILKDSPYTPYLINENQRIFLNPKAKDILFTPLKTKSIENIDDIYENIFAYDFSETSYIENFKDLDLSDINTSIDEIYFGYNSIKAKVKSDKSTFLNFSQNYFPGWRAYVNEKETPVYLVNGLIQGIEVPAGESVVEFKFVSTPIIIGAVISIVTLLFLISYFIYDTITEKKSCMQINVCT